MLSKNIFLKNFISKKKLVIFKSDLKDLLITKNEVIKSMSKDYKNKFEKNYFKKKYYNSPINVIGMGGSILGSKAIYNFLIDKVKKKISFFDNLEDNKVLPKKKTLNIIISKSGNTLETIINSSKNFDQNQRNIIVTEKRINNLNILAEKLKAEVIEHNNFIGGRYSVFSEVGMLPAELMGLNTTKFKQLNNLVKNKSFVNSLINNVNSIIYYTKIGKYNSIILNYDRKSESLLNWYQQLVAESLGKNGKGILPIISNMPKDNHSLMQHFLDGPKNNFFTFFFTHEKNSMKIKDPFKMKKNIFLKAKTINKILLAKKNASEKVFTQKKLPYRSFNIKNRSEESLSELFTFFTLETLLLAKALKVNPYNQPSVELIKKETYKFLKN